MLDTEEEFDLEQLGIGASFQDELCDMLASSQLLKDMEPGEIQLLSRYFGAYRAKQGINIFKEGRKSNFMCLVVDGKVDIIKDGDKKIATVRAGKTMGEMSIIDGQSHSASAMAKEDTRLVLITRNNFLKLVDEQAKLANKLLWEISKLMSFRLRQTTGMLCDYIS